MANVAKHSRELALKSADTGDVSHSSVFYACERRSVAEPITDGRLLFGASFSRRQYERTQRSACAWVDETEGGGQVPV